LLATLLIVAIGLAFVIAALVLGDSTGLAAAVILVLFAVLVGIARASKLVVTDRSDVLRWRIGIAAIVVVTAIWEIWTRM
jgi:hypothetical protein